jgi:uncharacterized membrane protein
MIIMLLMIVMMMIVENTLNGVGIALMTQYSAEWLRTKLLPVKMQSIVMPSTA